MVKLYLNPTKFRKKFNTHNEIAKNNAPFPSSSVSPQTKLENKIIC